MGEPMRADRAADQGKFCIWIESQSLGAQKLPDQYATASQASAAMNSMLRKLPRDTIRAIVYDSSGFFIDMRERI